MERNTAHRCTHVAAAVPSGKSKLEQFGYKDRIIKEHLVEITETVEDDRIRKLSLNIDILSHHRRQIIDIYVSKFEDYAGSTTPVEQKSTKKKKKDEDSDRKARSADIRKDKEYEIKIEYSEEELAEIEEYNASLEEDWDEDIDYDEYDEYYDDEN